MALSSASVLLRTRIPLDRSENQLRHYLHRVDLFINGVMSVMAIRAADGGRFGIGTFSGPPLHPLISS